MNNNNLEYEKVISDSFHSTKKWYTKNPYIRNRIIRSLYNYCSYKRKFINFIASGTDQSAYVIDLGAGNGAYSLWFLGRNPYARVIAIDWSYTALKNITIPGDTIIYRICADIHYLPLKEECCSVLFSVDTFGHVRDVEKVLDEIVRVTEKNATLFIHSECNDYQKKWPDSLCIEKNKTDYIAELDGHLHLKNSLNLYTLYNRRFYITSFINPAGIFRWLSGYPEKYFIVFRKAGMTNLALISSIFSLIKKIPLLNMLLKFINAFTNHCEVYFNINGGGSCFTIMKKINNNSL